MRDFFRRSRECFYLVLMHYWKLQGGDFFGRWAVFSWIDWVEGVQVCGPCDMGSGTLWLGDRKEGW